jgi:alkanesulfonate monooxygenase SsuD/methylene tetrahydromethanopterin reductase-like flavin-dependent oxidoreductase (luciferase family)
MRIGVAILLLALHNPVQIAEDVATLDIITGGRFVLGVGLGYREAEYAAFGVGKDAAVQRFEENLRIVTELLEGRSVDSDAPWCRTSGARLVNLPVQRPRPPIWIGANADAAVRRAARMGDTWIINPHAKREAVARQLELFRAERTAHGLPPEPTALPALKEVFCAPTREQAFRECLPHLGEKYRHYLAWGQDQAMPPDDPLDQPIDRLVDDRFIIGTPEDCLRMLAAWRDELGVDTFILRTEWVGMPHEVAMGSLELLSGTVVPALVAGRSTL